MSSDTATFTHFNGCDMMAHPYCGNRAIGELQAITYARSPIDNLYYGSLVFCVIEDIVPVSNVFWIELTFMNERRETWAIQLLDVEIISDEVTIENITTERAVTFKFKRKIG